MKTQLSAFAKNELAKSMKTELTKSDYKLLSEIVDTLIQNYEAGEEIELFSQKSDKVYILANKLKNLQKTIMEISITSAPDYNSLKETFNEYALLDPGIKLPGVVVRK